MGNAAPSAGGVFISYRRDETAYPAGWLYDRLVEHFDGEVFKDIDSIELGEDWVEAITEAVASCDVMLALIGDQWLTITDDNGRRRLDDPTDFVRVEIETALKRDVRVIPILVDGAQMPRAAELPPGLTALVRRQAMELSPARFDFDTSRLLEVLDETLDQVRAEQEQRAAGKTTGDRTPSDPRTTEQGTAAQRRDQASPSRATSTAPYDTNRGRFSTRRRILAGLGACVTVIAVLVSMVLLGSDAEPGNDDGGNGAGGGTTGGEGGGTTGGSTVEGSWVGERGAIRVEVTQVQNQSGHLRLTASVTNGTDDSLTLPLFGNATAVTNDGATYQASPSDSDWPETIASGQTPRGTIEFEGLYQPETGTLTLSFANMFGLDAPSGSLVVEGIRRPPR